MACNKYGLAALSDNSLMVSLSWGCLVKHLGELCAGNRKCGSMRTAGTILSFILFAVIFINPEDTMYHSILYGIVVPNPLVDRAHDCPSCGLVRRDLNCT